MTIIIAIIIIGAVMMIAVFVGMGWFISNPRTRKGGDASQKAQLNR